MQNNEAQTIRIVEYPNMVEVVASMCHEANRAYCMSLGDNSQKPWAEAADWQKQSAINGVNFFLKTRATPEEMHANWMKEKIENGWVYGEVKDEVAKTHHCLVDYQELPAEQRKKDHIFQNVIRLMIGHLE